MDAGAAADLVAASADIAVVLDKKGVVRAVSCENDAIAKAVPDKWIGQAWTDTVTIESRPKIEQMIAGVGSKTGQRWRQVNHPVSDGHDVPVTYRMVPLKGEGRILALGRDLSALAELQSRMVVNEQAIEREVARIRAAETRFRALFQLSLEGVLIADLSSLKIIEANPAAVEMLANGSRRVVGRPLADLVIPEHRSALESMIVSARAMPRVDDIEVSLANSRASVQISASVFRQENGSFLLLRLYPRRPANESVSRLGPRSIALGVLERLPDAIVLCDEHRRIVFCNAAFLELAEIGLESQVRGEPVGRWLGRVKVDEDILFANLREHENVRRYATAMRGEYGALSNVEISGAVVRDAESQYTCLCIRRQPTEVALNTPSGDPLPRSVQQLTELVGRVPLKELVRETTDIIERMCIEAALELTGDNRASAAEMLGLSRQSLYVKLRRFGFGEPFGDAE